MVRPSGNAGDDLGDIEGIENLPELAAALRRLKRRQARNARDAELTVRELAAKTGYAVGAIGAYFSGTTLPPTDRFDVLVQVLGATREEQRSLADARDRVMERRRKDGRALAAPRLPPAANMPPRNHRLVGRDDLIEQLSSSFAAGRNVQALRGMGGVGKTQLAIEYVYRNGADYDVAWLIDAEQPFLIPGQFVTLASHLGLVVDGEGDATTAYVLSHLAKLRSLLIFDDAAGPHRLTPFLPRRGDVLITTRATGFGALGAIVEVDVLARVDAVRLLQARNPALADDDAAELAALLGDLPIAVEQASAYLELTSCPVREYTTAVAEHPERLLRRGVVVGYRYNLANVWSMSINRVAHERPDAMQLLGLCAYLDGTPIPLEIFRAGRDHLPPELAAQLDNPIDFADTVGTLVGFALARRSDDFLFIHRMVQAAVRAHTSTPGPGSGRDDVIDRLTQLLRAAAPVEIWMESTAVSRWRVLMPHVLAVLKRQDGSGTGVNETAWLLDHAGTYLHAAGQAERATSLLARAVELGTSSSAPDDLPILSARLHWAVALRDSGAYDLAEDQYRAVMERYRSRYGEDSLEVAHVVAELGAVRLYRGDYEEAERCFALALEMRLRHLGPDHTDTLGALNDLACLNIVRGELDAAEPILRQIRARWLDLHGEEHRRTLNAANNLAIVLRDLGRLAEAEEVNRDLMVIRTRVHGPNHPNTLAARSNLALVFQAQGRLAEAERMLRDVVNDNRALHGDDHPHTLAGLHRVAVVLGARGDVAQARSMFEHVLAGRQRLLGVDHPDTLSTRTALDTLPAQ